MNRSALLRLFLVLMVAVPPQDAQQPRVTTGVVTFKST